MFVLCIDANKCYFHSVEVHSYFEARCRLWFADRLISLQGGKVHLGKKNGIFLEFLYLKPHNISLLKMSRAHLLDVFMEQHLCNSVLFDLGAGVRCMPSGIWLRHRELGRKTGISQKAGWRMSGYASEIPQQLWINAVFQLSSVSVEAGIWREAVPAPLMPGKAMAAL